jgi:hypothetical protein
MLDFLVGLDTECSDVVEGSHVYYPGDVALQARRVSCSAPGFCIRFDPIRAVPTMSTLHM